jgi:hypothetical protein
MVLPLTIVGASSILERELATCSLPHINQVQYLPTLRYLVLIRCGAFHSSLVAATPVIIHRCAYNQRSLL